LEKRVRDQLVFFRQFRERFHTTGAVAPSSRFLARAMARPMSRRNGPARILEVGPGTGAVTRRLVNMLGPDDRLDLVELNPAFVALLRERFQHHAAYQRVAEQSTVHACPLQEFNAGSDYDFVISGLPMNNFSPELVREIFQCFFRLLKPGGTLSYFEYMFVRPVRKLVTSGGEKARLASLDGVIGEYRSRYHVRTDWIFANIPPAWVQHLQNRC
jgi:phospholipid N-methyltransferase